MDVLSNCEILSRPDGSAVFNQGQTTVLAAVYGPVECRTAKILIDKAHIEMYYRPKVGLPSVGDKLNETILRNICETALVTALYPRSSIVIVVQEMENGGELLSSAINAVCLALLSSGIDMKFMIAAVTCCLDSDATLIMNPSANQMKMATANFVFVFDSLNGGVVASHTTGLFTVDDYENALSLSKENSGKVFEYYKNVMNKFIN